MFHYCHDLKFSDDRPPDIGGYGSIFLNVAIQECLSQEDQSHDPLKELRTYLDDPLEKHTPGFDRARWWGVRITIEFDILFLIKA